MAILDRFRDAQGAPHSGFAVALRELESGRKTSHWIWYVFPQLAGLGRSSAAVYYGLAGAEEAADYLRDPVLGERLITATAGIGSWGGQCLIMGRYVRGTRTTRGVGGAGGG